MDRPTIALCCILKNEAHNISRLLQSVKGCFDEIHMTDTGSTDGSVEFMEKINEQIENNDPEWQGIPKINIHHFEWVHDFAAARNYSFSHATTDYVMWLDLDDVLSSADDFISFRDKVMHTAQYWLAIYHYAFNEQGEPICSFLRERIVSNKVGFKWKYFVHEGLVPPEGKAFSSQRVSSFTVNHLRSKHDMEQDQSRNLNIFKMRDLSQEHPRMLYYYGKELFENGNYKEAGKWLHDAMKSDLLELPDRINCVQYAASSALYAKAFEQALQLVHLGLTLSPNRAEFWCLGGDCLLGKGHVQGAEVYYKSALNSNTDTMGGLVIASPYAKSVHPLNKLIEIYLSTGNHEDAWTHLQALKEVSQQDYEKILPRFKEVKRLSTIHVDDSGKKKTDDILITCPPGMKIPVWDERSLQDKDKGLGGSETACVEIAKFLKQKTGRPVKVFNVRDQRDVMPSGVEYLPVSELSSYLSWHVPHVHIAWRHATRLTTAQTYVWSHDLLTPGGEQINAYDKYLCLSGFHKEYVKTLQNVPDDKILVVKNGINPDDFNGFEIKKDENKIFYSSSPDRGLDRAIKIVEKARDICGQDLKLHVFYGFENMKNGPLHDMAVRLEKLINDSPFVVYHGNTPKSELYKHMRESIMWLYPANFIETFCITAWESLACGAYPLVRNMGALPYTLSDFKDMSTILNSDAETEEEIECWANEVVKVKTQRLWEKVNVEPQKLSWEAAADQFIMDFIGG